jgi:hypothetical protein
MHYSHFFLVYNQLTFKQIPGRNARYLFMINVKRNRFLKKNYLLSGKILGLTSQPDEEF